MATVFLNAQEKKTGQKSMFRAEFFNGFASNFLGETVIILLATYFSAGNIVLGYLSSAIFVAGIILPWAPKILNNKNFQKAHSTTWLLRGIISLAYVALFWISDNQAVVLIVVIYTIFCFFRIIGITLNDYSMKSITSLKNRGNVFAKVSVIYQGSSLLAKLVSVIVTSIAALSGLLGLMVLPPVGFIANCFASFWYSRIPCRRNYKYNPKRSLWVIMSESLKDSNKRKKILLKWLIQGIYISMAMTIPFLKNVVGMSSSMVLLFTLVGSFSMIIASMLVGKLSDRIGAKPLIIIFSIIFMFIIAAWVSVPANAPLYLFFILGFAFSFVMAVEALLVQKVVAAIIPDEEAVPFNSMVNFGIGITAFFVGIISGILVTPGTAIFRSTAFGNGYSLTFALALVQVIICFFLAIRMKETKCFTTQQAFSAIFTMRGLRAFSMIGKIDKTKDPLKRKILLFNLGTNFTCIATEELRAKLASPYSVDKQEIIRALADKPRNELVNELSTIALDDDSYVQMDAITALGSYTGNQTAIQTLEKLLDCHWSQVRSQASKSLSQITDASTLDEKIEGLSLVNRHIDEEIDYITAKNNIDQKGAFLDDFWIAVTNKRSAGYRQTRYSVIAGFFKFGIDRLTELYEHLNSRGTEDFLEEFLPDARDIEEIDENYKTVYNNFMNNEVASIKDFCLSLVKKSEVENNKKLSSLKKGLLKAETIPSEDFDIQDMVAFIYFAYGLMKNSR